MLVVKIGGPAYRIGMGGGAASSKAGGEDEANADLDFNAVQRGDAEMSNKLNRVVKACVELEGTGTPSSPSTIRAPAATATCARSSSTPRVVLSTSAP